MSLMLWYPCNGHIKNYGILGGKYDFQGNVSYQLYSRLGTSLVLPAERNILCDEINYNKFTIAFWVKSNTPNSEGKILELKTKNITNSTQGSLVFLQRTNYSTISVDNDSKDCDTTSTVFATQTETNTWMHICYTYNGDNGKINCYKNGEEITSRIGMIGGQLNKEIIFFSSYSGYVNDVRIYDDCISIKEIKELSRAKILHYPMNNVYHIIESDYSQFEAENYIEYHLDNLYIGSGIDEIQVVQSENKSVFRGLSFNPKDTVGKNYKISFLARSLDGNNQLILSNTDEDPRYLGFDDVKIDVTTDWVLYSFVVENKDKGFGYNSKMKNCCKVEMSVNNGQIEIKNLKVSEANESPSPEEPDQPVDPSEPTQPDKPEEPNPGEPDPPVEPDKPEEPPIDPRTINLFSGYEEEEEIDLGDYTDTSSYKTFSFEYFDFNPSKTVGRSYKISFYAKSPNGQTDLYLSNWHRNPRYFAFGGYLQNPKWSINSNQWTYCEYTVVNSDDGSSYSSAIPDYCKLVMYANSAKNVLVKNITINDMSGSNDLGIWTEGEKPIVEHKDNLFTGYVENEEIPVGTSNRVYFYSNNLTFNPATTVGKKYRITFWAKSSDTVSKSIHVYGNSSNRYFYINFTTTNPIWITPNKWKLCSYTFENTDRGSSYSSSTSNYYFYIQASTTNAKIRNICVEEIDDLKDVTLPDIAPDGNLFTGFDAEEIFTLSSTTTQFHGNFAFNACNTVGKSYIISCDAKASKKGKFGFQNTSQNTKYFYFALQQPNVQTSWTHVSRTITNTERSTNVAEGLLPYNYNKLEMTAGSTGFQVKNIRIEEVASNEIVADPYSRSIMRVAMPMTNEMNGMDVEYDTDILFNNNIIYDMSGYDNNGEVVIGKCPMWSTDSMIGTGSYQFNASQDLHINANVYMNTDNFDYTVMFWRYETNSNVVQCSYNVGSCDYVFSNGVIYNAMSTSNIYPFIDNNNQNVSYTLNQWEYYAFVHTATEIKVYKNGVYAGKAKTYQSIVGATNIRINGKYSDGSNMGNGRMSDFRIYATALSDSDIKEIYEYNDVSLQYNGTLLCNEYIENDKFSNPSFGIKGLIKSIDVRESCLPYINAIYDTNDIKAQIDNKIIKINEIVEI